MSQGSEAYKYHGVTYGHPSKFGYKDICRLFTAPLFDQAQTDRLVKLYKLAGARYVVPVAVHHDNFDMWDSKYQPRFNSVATSGKDIVGMWKVALSNWEYIWAWPRMSREPIGGFRFRLGPTVQDRLGGPLRWPESGIFGSLQREME